MRQGNLLQSAPEAAASPAPADLLPRVGRLETRPVRVDEWRGLVVAGSAGADIQDAGAWTSWLQRLVHDSTSLPGYAQLKYSRANEVIRAELPVGPGGLPAVQVICKRSSPRGVMTRWMSRLGRSRARRNFERGLLLQSLGMGTARPLAIIERPMTGESWLVTECLRDILDLDQLALTYLPQLQPAARGAVKRAAIAAVARLFAQLQENGLHHRDLKATNVLLCGLQSDVPVRAVLVDLDGLRRSRFAARERRQRMMRLAASLAEYPTITRTDYARFLRRLLPDDSWRMQVRALAPAARRYNRAAERRRRQRWSRLES